MNIPFFINPPHQPRVFFSRIKRSKNTHTHLPCSALKTSCRWFTSGERIPFREVGGLSCWCFSYFWRSSCQWQARVPKVLGCLEGTMFGVISQNHGKSWVLFIEVTLFEIGYMLSGHIFWGNERTSSIIDFFGFNQVLQDLWFYRQSNERSPGLGYIGDEILPSYLGIIINSVVVSNIFYFHPYLGKISNLTNIFQMGWNHQPVNPIKSLQWKAICFFSWLTCWFCLHPRIFFPDFPFKNIGEFLVRQIGAQ